MPRLLDLLADDSSRKRLAQMGGAKTGRNRTRGQSVKRRGLPPETPRKLPLWSFVALDFETTGLETRQDRVIEIGAVRFVKGKEVESLSVLVNPGRPIPPGITTLTGISDAEVVDAPPFERVFERLIAFIGKLPVCGHQVDFDLSFLAAEMRRLGHARITNQQIDTASLARLVLPNLAAYSLGHVSAHLGIPLVRAHRALDDARATGQVAAALLPRLIEIRPDIRRLLANFAPSSVIKRLLFDSLQGEEGREPAAKRTQHQRWERIKPRDGAAQLDEQCVVAHLSAEGLGRILPQFEPRIQQLEMARAAVRTLNGASFLVAEAGTGTGKSLAYLVPAAEAALARGHRVVVSTHTRNLQDQLATKDLPLVRELLGDQLRFTVLKGRSNYLCRYRYERLLQGQLGNLSPRERMGLLPLVRWAEETETGDVEEQRQFSRKRYAKVWNLIAADSSGCAGHRCSVGSACFVQRARQRALGSHVVVINHALFYSDMCCDSAFLSTAGPLVFDEAHHLEACGHRSLSVVLDTHRVTQYLEFCTTTTVRLEKTAGNDAAVAVSTELKRLLRHVRHAAEGFLAALDSWSATRIPGVAEYQCTVEPHVLESLPQAGPLRIALDDFQEILLRLQRAFSASQSEDPALLTDIESCVAQTSQLRADYAYLCAAKTEDHVFWLEGNHQRGWVKLNGVPLDIGELLRDVWGRTEGGAIFTSATLSIAETMEYFTRRVGLHPWHQQRVHAKRFASPFSAEQAMRVTVSTAPPPSTPGFAAYCAGVIRELHERLERNTLVLFTANSMLREVEMSLREAPCMQGAPLYSQASGMSRGMLMQQFKETPGAILLGTSSFWEGVDAPGTSCEIVIIPRLPFHVPTEPLAQAMAVKAEQEYGESFYSYSIPEAVIRLRQGAGRLIRTATDRGALVILDSRIVTKSYGRTFVASLDGKLEIYRAVDEMVNELDRFFGSGTGCRDTGGGRVERYIPLDEEPDTGGDDPA